MYCNTCGRPEQFKGKSDNEYYPYLYECPNGHKILSQEVHKCPEGMKEVRTKASNGYQTSHIPMDWDERYFKDKNYHSVNLTVAFNSNNG